MTSKRGFASMSPDKQAAIASKGGKAAHEQGRAHVFTPDEARAAGRKGGSVTGANREHMSAIGILGGVARRRGRKKGEKSTSELTDAELDALESREKQ